MTLTFIYGHWKLELVQSVCCKSTVMWKNFTMVDLAREVPLKKFGRCGKYGSFEQWAFLFIHRFYDVV